MKSLLSIMFCLILCTNCCAFALANEQQIVQYNGESPVTLFSFSSELPQILNPIANNNAFQGVEIVCGAVISKEPDDYLMEDEPNTYGSIASLIITKAGGRRQLIGVSCVNGGAWHVAEFGDRLFRQEYEPELDIVWVRNLTRPAFAVSYSGHNQHLMDLFSFSGNRIWEMIGHLNESEKLEIYTTQNGFSVTDSGHEYQCSRARGYWMEYMNSIEEFPNSYEACKMLEIQNLKSNMSVLYGYTMEGDLFVSPSHRARSLGSYSCYIPFIYLNESKIYGSERWLKVQIGSTVGWMREVDCCLGESLPQYPVSVGKARQDVILFGDSSAASEIKRIPLGTYFHVLGETDNGLYHICIPRGRLSWNIDMTGIYGYVQKDEVFFGGSISEIHDLE